MRALFQSYSANKPREPHRSGTAEHAPRLVLRNGHGAKKNSFFLIASRHRIQPPSQAGAPPPHPITKPSRVWLLVGGSKPQLVLITSDPTRTKVMMVN